MLNPIELERYIQACAQRGDLTVEWVKGQEVASTNGKVMRLPALTSRTTLQHYKRLRHYATHEVDHVLYSDFELLEKTGLTPTRSFLGAIWNCTEDHRIEYLGDMEYEGDRLCNNDVDLELHKMVADKIKEAQGAGHHEMVDNMLPLLTFDARVKADYHPSLHQVVPLFEGLMSPKAKGYYEKLKAGNYADVLRNIRQIPDRKKGTQATLDLAKRIFKEVFEQDPEAEQQRCAAEAEAERAAKAKAKQEGKQREGTGGSDTGDGEESNGEHGKDKKNRTKFATVDYTQLIVDVHDPANPNCGMRIDYSKHKDQYDYRPARIDDYQVHDEATESPHDSPYEIDHTSQIRRALGGTSAGFAHKVRTILQIRDRDRYHYGQKRGRLNQSSLHRIVVDAPGYNERVFKRKEVNDVLNCAVTLLVDQSGSMSGNKFGHAAAAATMLNDTVGNVLHIPCEVVTFTDWGFSPTGNGHVRHMHIIRKFKDKRVASDEIQKRFVKAAKRGMAGNADGDAIMWVFDRLIRRPEKRKVLVVFSDGSPSGGGCGDIMAYTKKVVKAIEQESPVNIVGIGIEDTNVSRIYKEHYVIHDASELEIALLSLIENKLK